MTILFGILVIVLLMCIHNRMVQIHHYLVQIHWQLTQLKRRDGR